MESADRAARACFQKCRAPLDRWSEARRVRSQLAVYREQAVISNSQVSGSTPTPESLLLFRIKRENYS